MDLSFIVIFGTRWHFRDLRDGWKGHLVCPACQGPEPFVEQEAFKAFTVYWFPLFRTEEGGRLVSCQRCNGKFEKPDVLLSGTAPQPEIPALPDETLPSAAD